jgi:hypothetical protein
MKNLDRVDLSLLFPVLSGQVGVSGRRGKSFVVQYFVY